MLLHPYHDKTCRQCGNARRASDRKAGRLEAHLNTVRALGNLDLRHSAAKGREERDLLAVDCCASALVIRGRQYEIGLLFRIVCTLDTLVFKDVRGKLPRLQPLNALLKYVDVRRIEQALAFFGGKVGLRRACTMLISCWVLSSPDFPKARTLCEKRVASLLIISSPTIRPTLWDQSDSMPVCA